MQENASQLQRDLDESRIQTAKSKHIEEFKIDNDS